MVEEGIRSGSLREALKAEIQEGKDLYALRIPEEVRRLGIFTRRPLLSSSKNAVEQGNSRSRVSDLTSWFHPLA
jgi:hypothetical protein